MMKACAAVPGALLLLSAPRAPSPTCCASSRRERRVSWWHENKPVDEPRGRLFTTQEPPFAGGPHPLFALLDEAADAHETVDPMAAVDALREGDRVLCQVVGSSPLGLSLAILPHGAQGLVFADEAGYPPEDGTGAPAALGDVVPGYVCHVRDDAKVDVSWRRPGTQPKLAAAAETLLAALADGAGHVPLGDASRPQDIRAALGLSKANFKAARGTLLREGYLTYPLAPHETVLAPGASAAAAGGPAAGKAAVAPGAIELRDLPAAAHFRVSGANALLRLLSPRREVSSLRGLVRDGEPTGHVVAVLAGGARAASEVVAALSGFDGRAGGGPADGMHAGAHTEPEPAPRVLLVDTPLSGRPWIMDDDQHSDDHHMDEQPPPLHSTRADDVRADSGRAAAVRGARVGRRAAWEDEGKASDSWPHDEWAAAAAEEEHTEWGARRGTSFEPRGTPRGRDGAAAGAAAGGTARGGEHDGARTAGVRPNSIFVGNLPMDVTEDDLWDVFLEYA
jgi:hypothetical protein